MAAVPHRARGGNAEPGDLPAQPRAEAVADRVRRALDPPAGRPLRREPVPLPAVLAVPGRPQAGAGGRARPVLGLAGGDRHRPPARTTCGWSRTTGSSRRSAPGASAGRSGATAWRSRSGRTSSSSAAMDVELVPAEITYGLERLAMAVQGKTSAFELEWAPGCHLGRHLSGERAPVVDLQLRGGAGRDAPAPLRRVRGRVPPPARAPAAAARLRPGAQGARTPSTCSTHAARCRRDRARR